MDTETVLIISFSRYFVTSSRKGQCVMISRRSGECDSRMQLSCLKSKPAMGVDAQETAYGTTSEVLGRRNRSYLFEKTNGKPSTRCRVIGRIKTH